MRIEEEIKLDYSKWPETHIGVEPIGFPINKNLRYFIMLKKYWEKNPNHY